MGHVVPPVGRLGNMWVVWLSAMSRQGLMERVILPESGLSVHTAAEWAVGIPGCDGWNLLHRRESFLHVLKFIPSF